jgi:NADPH:quinone reductase-like Zn-dependent oxidoreductase
VIPELMSAVLLTGHGDYDMLDYRTDVPTPVPQAGEVLIKVGAAGINNTDINTRIAWYTDGEDGSWGGEAMALPRIQGADVCGHIVAVGDGVSDSRTGDRVLVRSMQPRPTTENLLRCEVIGSEYDGGYAQYVATPSAEAIAINSTWTDVELGSLPCAYSTAEAMLDRASVGAERVVITGASGGVGTAAVQLAKRRGAYVIALSGAAKADDVRSLGADLVLDRGCDIAAELGKDSVDVTLDVVAGDTFPKLIEILKPGGRYCTVGAISGPVVELDVRSLYLKDLSLFGSTYQPPEVFDNLVSYVEANEIRPFVAKTFPLSEVVQAQQAFVSKTYAGKLVLIP